MARNFGETSRDVPLSGGIKDGDEVLVSSCSIHSTAGAIISVGAKPIFVDIEATSLNFDPNYYLLLLL